MASSMKPALGLAVATVHELVPHIQRFLRTERAMAPLQPEVAQIQAWVQQTGAQLSALSPSTAGSAAASDRPSSSEFELTSAGGPAVEQLERWIDKMEDRLPTLRNFILPGGGLPAALLHVCRSVTRRAERRVVPLVREYPRLADTGRFYNRLSDYFFVAARYTAHQHGEQETAYHRQQQ